MHTIISRTTSLGHRLAIALLSLTLLLQGQAVLAMACHSDQGTQIGAAHTDVADSAHHKDHMHERHDLSADSLPDMPLDQQDCAHCAGCCAMNYVTCTDACDAPARFKSPSPSVFTGALGPGNVPEGLLRPPR